MLAGGASRRFGGGPKGLSVIGSTRLIDRVVDALTPVAGSVILAANDPAAPGWLAPRRVTVVADRYPGAGGLAGVEAALAAGGDVLVAAWDMPFVTPRLLQEILDTARSRDASVVVPESHSPHGVEPFCAYYGAAAREPLAAYLARGEHAAHAFLASLPRVVRLPLHTVREIDDPRRLFFSVNTPADLERARAIAAAQR